MEISGKPSQFAGLGFAGMVTSMGGNGGFLAPPLPSSAANALPSIGNLGLGLSPTDLSMFLQNSNQQLQMHMFAKAQQQLQQQLQQQMSEMEAVTKQAVAQQQFQQQMNELEAAVAKHSRNHRMTPSATVTSNSFIDGADDSIMSDNSGSGTGSVSSPLQMPQSTKSNIDGLLQIKMETTDEDITSATTIDCKPVVQSLRPSTSLLSHRSQKSPTRSPQVPSPETPSSPPGLIPLASLQNHPAALSIMTSTPSPVPMTSSPLTSGGGAGPNFMAANQMAAALVTQQQQSLHHQMMSSSSPVADPAVAMAMNPMMGPSSSIMRALALNGGATSQRRPRSEKKPIPGELKDGKYFERRKRNNMAAKKSRDARKMREDDLAMRAGYLEKENAVLRAQVSTLREEANSLRQLLLQKRSRAGQ